MTELKVTIQTLKNDHHELQVLTTDTVTAVKVAIESKLNLGIKATEMALIHMGKVLSDADQTMADAKVESGHHMVIMKQKKKKKKKKGTKAAAAAAAAQAAPATSAPAPAATTPTTPATPATPASSTPAPSTPAPETPASTEVKATSSDPSSQGAASGMALGSELQDTIAQLMSLGDFSHDQVAQALRAAFNNPDRAAEYLFTGIPANILAQQNAAPTPQGQAPAQQGAPMDQSGDGMDTNLGMGGGDAPSQADIQNMGAMFQQNPEMMAALMQGLAQQEGGQEMLAQLQQNPQALMRMLQAVAQGGMGGQGGQGGMGGQGAQGAPPGARQIQLTEAEAASLQRLQALAPGVSQQQALQAFLVCDRNEELAANYLLDQMYG